MTRTDPAQYPAKAADALRLFNHATLPKRDGAGIAYPGTAYRAIGNLATLSHRLPQALDHIAVGLTGLHKAGHLTADHGAPATHTAAAVKALRRAEELAIELTKALERAHTATGPLGYGGQSDNTDDDL
ncbi:hypothetical protein [Streptomyces sp. NBC_01185]|uniref:hypothetical protein n=1 Tax=Streptomyces sp. NBC_01185 TaxID=2903764 RepID=UPI00386470B8|nr:hypothetical protein OG770_27135 [Streptomyces sp. NBC_01185]